MHALHLPTAVTISVLPISLSPLNLSRSLSVLLHSIHKSLGWISLLHICLAILYGCSIINTTVQLPWPAFSS